MVNFTLYNTVLDFGTKHVAIYYGRHCGLRRSSGSIYTFFDIQIFQQNHDSTYTFFNILEFNIQIFQHTSIQHAYIWTYFISTQNIIQHLLFQWSQFFSINIISSFIYSTYTIFWCNIISTYTQLLNITSLYLT